MTVEEFITKWKASKLKERSASQEHFLDLCHLLGQPTPAQADSTGTFYTFERGAAKHGGGNGFADVWLRGHFAWEYKGKQANIAKAYDQLLRYRSALENPPLLVVSDMETIEIHTNFTGTPEQVHTIGLDDLKNPDVIQQLKWLFTEPERFRPGVTTEQITRAAAEQFATLAQTLRDRGHPPQAVAHFLSKLLFCLFAEDVGLLPKRLFSRMVDSTKGAPHHFNEMLRTLLVLMNSGGTFGIDRIRHFNGGLFNDDVVLPLTTEDGALLRLASDLDWSKVEPSIFGTLFERGLDPDKRSQLGAHYTSRTDIERVVYPVIIEPLRREWQEVMAAVEQQLAKIGKKTTKGAETTIRKGAVVLIVKFLDQRVRSARVLDPACGSGNFLYVALTALHDLELECLVELGRAESGSEQVNYDIQVGPHQMRGIEINPYAAELAWVTIWIGDLQWYLRNGMGFPADPLLKKLELIENRDAVLGLGNKPATWPEADYIIGNPPFLGCKRMYEVLGVDYTKRLRRAYSGSVPGMADLVCFWFEQSRRMMASNPDVRVGLVSTRSIRGGKSRSVLDEIAKQAIISNAWSNLLWVVDGADVRICIACFGAARWNDPILLDGQPEDAIGSDLRPRSMAESQTSQSRFPGVKTLPENRNVSFVGTIKGGPLDIDGVTARKWLVTSGNPNGRPNSDVLKPWVNGMDVTRRSSGKWIIDFDQESNPESAALFELPFEYVLSVVKPKKDGIRKGQYRQNWWLPSEPQWVLRQAIAKLSRYIVTPTVSKHRVFAWLHSAVVPDHQLVAFTRDDDTFFGILHSRFHELWSLGLVTWQGKGGDPRYTPTTTFMTFPFPQGLTPNVPASEYASDPRAKAIAAAAMRLEQLRQNWLNPPEHIRREPEVVPDLPDRILPKDDVSAAELKSRTLTNLYNLRPTWLVNAHQQLDAAVAAAYGWPHDLTDDEILANLLALNLERARH